MPLPPSTARAFGEFDRWIELLTEFAVKPETEKASAASIQEPAFRCSDALRAHLSDRFGGLDADELLRLLLDSRPVIDALLESRSVLPPSESFMSLVTTPSNAHGTATAPPPEHTFRLSQSTRDAFVGALKVRVGENAGNAPGVFGIRRKRSDQDFVQFEVPGALTNIVRQAPRVSDHRAPILVDENGLATVVAKKLTADLGLDPSKSAVAFESLADEIRALAHSGGHLPGDLPLECDEIHPNVVRATARQR